MTGRPTLDDTAPEVAAELHAARTRIAELVQSLDAHQRLIENARDMVWRTDIGGKVLYVNAYAADFLGGVGADFIGETMEEYFTEASARQVANGVRASLFATPPLPFFQCEVEYRHRDGHLVPAEVRITAERDASGRVVALDGISRGIAERKKAELELNQQRAFFEQLFKQSCVSTQILDKDGWCERINPRLTELFGVLPEHIEGRVYNIFKDEGVRQGGVLPHLERVFREGDTAEWEVHFDIGLAADSQGIEVREKVLRWFHNWAYPIFDERGALSHVIVQHVDITDRKRTDAALASTEERYRILFERSPDALMTLAPPSWNYASANPAALAVFGVDSVATFIAMGPAQFSPEQQPDGTSSAAKARAMGELAMRNGAHSFEWTHRRLSGEEFPATVVLTRLELDGQSVLHAIVRDDTEKKRLQASLAQADRLTSMGMLAAGVAHEINNPLAYVLASVESLAQELPKIASGGLENSASAAMAELLETAASALEGTRRIASIARALGTFAHVERTERAYVDLNHAIDLAAAMANNEIKYRATLIRELGEVPRLWASEGKLSQVFLNLLINAAHATPEGSAGAHRITVRSWTAGDDVFAEVRDTGTGIAPENLERIFDPFFTTKAAGKGSGLGLAICKTLVAEFGGALSVASELGKGTRFVVRLPIGHDEPGKRSAPPAARAASTSASVRGRVLVVDDEEQIRVALVRLLRRDHEVVTAASGREAQTLFQRGAVFDVILCDLMMPEFSGVELHEWLVIHDPVLAARLVFVSGGALTAGAAEYLRTLDNQQVSKPFESRVLSTMVAELVGKARGVG